MIHFGCDSAIPQPIFIWDWSLFFYNISPNENLSQATSRTWWKHIDVFCATLSCFPYSSSFTLQWPLTTPYQLLILTSVLAESIQDHLVWYPPPPALGSLGPRCHCLALYLVNSQCPSHPRWHLDQPSHHFSNVNFQGPEFCSGALSSSLLAGWWSFHFIWWTFNIWVHTPGRSFADKPGGTDDLSDNVNAAAPSCWKFHQDALTISSVSEIYPKAVIWSLWVRDSFCVACRFWLPCHTSKKLWTMAILCNIHSSASLCNSRWFAVLVIATAGSPLINILIWAFWRPLTMIFSRTVLAGVFHCHQQLKSCSKEIVDSTPTPCGMAEDIWHPTSERSVFFKCVSSGPCHQLVRCGIQNVLQISQGSE